VKRLIIVSNRLPITVARGKKDSPLEFRSSIGGLSTGLSSFYRSYNALWIGWPGIAVDRLKEKDKNNIVERLSRDGCYPVFLTQREVDNYYHGFCNNVLWPLFHYFPSYVVNKNVFWETYKSVNQKFANTVAEFTDKNNTVWIHDYQLMLLPDMLRKRLEDTRIGFFLHIPFPSYEIFRMLPYRKEILKGILGANLIGFHTYDYVRYFLESVRRILGIDSNLGYIYDKKHIIKADIFPIGINFEKFSVESEEIENETENIRNRIGDIKVILSVDRLDYTKGIIQKLQAFDRFLDRNPKYIGKVAMVIIVVPSRTNIEHYRALKNEIDELIGNINGKRSTFKWSPIHYLYRSLPFERLLALYRISDIALITPLRDGMNLVAKEFLASKQDGKGVLILSEMTGAAQELGEAVIVNPNDTNEIVNALEIALGMQEGEQIRRNRTMIGRLRRYDIIKWAVDFMGALDEVEKLQERLFMRLLNLNIRRKIIESYRKSDYRVLLLDYDGTLVGFSSSPEEARPDRELLEILEELSSDKRNSVVIISGRSRETLSEWFDDLNIGMIAEHGAWVKRAGRDWQTIEPLTSEWKSVIKPILELYEDRTPGSFIEEKEFSLVWHYRRADSKLAALRAMELKNTLLEYVTNLGLEVMDGNKILEVKDAGVDKGRAALKWLADIDTKFVLAIGDDYTDENVFEVLPESAYTIKVGLGFSKAKYNIISVEDVRRLLKELISGRVTE